MTMYTRSIRCATNRCLRGLLVPALFFFAGCSGTQGSSSTEAQTSNAGSAGAITGSIDRSVSTNTTARASTGGIIVATTAGEASPGAVSSGSTTAGTATSGATATGTTSTSASSGTSSGSKAGSPAAGTGSSGTGGSGTGSTTAVATPAPAVEKKSISGWVSCTGTSDDALGTIKAFSAAKNKAFTLVVDCPVLIHSALDIDRAIFIEDGTTVEFSGAGKFIVDDIFHPAFVIANSKDITLTNWNVEFDGSMPVNPDVHGYMRNGQWIAKGGFGQPTNGFNDERLTPWLKANKSLAFDTSQGPVNSYWAGTTNTCAMFFMVGDSSNINVTGMHVYAPTNVGGERFVPVVFSFNLGYKSNQSVTMKTPITAQYIAVPHDVTFTDTVLDGTYMGWVGTARNLEITHTQSHRYADLQDAAGANVGGIGKWFAPPHLFYLSYASAGDANLFNSKIQIKNVVDDGPRVGTARDKGGTDSFSGYALSLKIGAVDSSVDTYTSTRPDGFLDVLDSNGLTISNATATYDSSFINNLFPGWRFPKSSYKNVSFQNITLTDNAKTTVQQPIGNAPQATNENLTFANVKVVMNRWGGKNLPLPSIGGTLNNISFDYTMTADATRVTSLEQGSVAVTLRAQPAILPVGNTALLTWWSKQATACSASGAWSGALASTGSQIVVPSSTGNYDFTFYCQNSGAASSTTLVAKVTAN